MKHNCPTCGQTCRAPAQPKVAAFDYDGIMHKWQRTRYRGACPVCKHKSFHQPGCALKAEQRRRGMQVWQAEQSALRAAGKDPLHMDLSWLSMTIPWSEETAVGGVVFRDKADAAAMRARITAYEAAQDAARQAHDAWTAAWKAALEPTPQFTIVETGEPVLEELAA